MKISQNLWEDLLSDFAFEWQKMNQFKIHVISTLFALFLIVLVFIGLEIFFQKTSFEVIESWLANETINIQQGNILSSVGKFQRIVSNSNFIIGVSVQDPSDNDLVIYGKTYKIDISTDQNLKIISSMTGVFQRVFFIKIKDLKIHIFTESRILLVLFISLAGIVMIFFGIFVFFLKKFLVQEEKFQSQVELQRIKIESLFNEKIADISRQIAHDIRSPLSLINIISAKIKYSLPEEGELLLGASTRIISIAEELLKLTRIESGPKFDNMEKDFVYLPEEYFSSEIVESKLIDLINSKKIEFGTQSSKKISFYCDVEQKFLIRCNLSDLFRIISNLINNSIEAISDSGYVSITLSNIENSFLIECRDSGKGMDSDLIRRVYINPTTEGKSNGNGLGLNYSIRKVQSWGGQLQIQSSSGFGTTISIELPIKQQDPNP